VCELRHYTSVILRTLVLEVCNVTHMDPSGGSLWSMVMTRATRSAYYWEVLEPSETHGLAAV
jgi:hypothetical protein